MQSGDGGLCRTDRGEIRGNMKRRSPFRFPSGDNRDDMVDEELKKTFVIKELAFLRDCDRQSLSIRPVRCTDSFLYTEQSGADQRRDRAFPKGAQESEKQLLDLKSRLSDLGGGWTPLYHRCSYHDSEGSEIRRPVNPEHPRKVRQCRMGCPDDRRQIPDIFDRMEDDYLRGRISDIQYAGQRILANLTGEKKAVLDVGEKVVIIANDLSPADTAQMKIDSVLGFATDIGGKTSHTAIVAVRLRSSRCGFGEHYRDVRTNDDIIIDGSAGVVIVHPDPEVRRRYADKKRLYEAAQDDLLDSAHLPL